MLTNLHLNEKSREACIKARSPTSVLAYMGQVTEHTTIKWLVASLVKNNVVHDTLDLAFSSVLAYSFTPNNTSFISYPHPPLIIVLPGNAIALLSRSVSSTAV